MTTPPFTLPRGADPALGYPGVDVESIVYTALRQFGASVVVWAYAAGPLQPRNWLAETDVQVDVRAHNKPTAWRFADAARRIVCALPWGDLTRGVIARVDVIDGPTWLPDPDGKPRYVARFAIRAHPARRR